MNSITVLLFLGSLGHSEPLHERAAAGCSLAMLQVYEQEKNKGQDIKAREWLMKAVDLNDPYAFMVLSGHLKEEGNLQGALRLIRAAASLGYYVAIKELLWDAEASGDLQGTIEWSIVASLAGDANALRILLKRATEKEKLRDLLPQVKWCELGIAAAHLSKSPIQTNALVDTFCTGVQIGEPLQSALHHVSVSRTNGKFDTYRPVGCKGGNYKETANVEE